MGLPKTFNFYWVEPEHSTLALSKVTITKNVFQSYFLNLPIDHKANFARRATSIFILGSHVS
jgi:hypothetical protein